MSKVFSITGSPADWTTVVKNAETGTVAADTLFDGAMVIADSAGNPVTVRKTFDTTHSKILIRIGWENQRGNTNAANTIFLQLLDAADTVVARMYVTTDGSAVWNAKPNTSALAAIGTPSASFLRDANQACYTEMWISYYANDGAGYMGAGNCANDWSVGKGLTNGNYPIKSIVFGPSGGTFVGGGVLHEFSVWDARPDDADEIFGMATLAQYAGCPAVVDVSDAAAKRVADVDISSDCGENWTALAVADVTATRPTGALTDYEWAHASFDLDDGTMDGMFVTFNAGDPAEFFPPSVVLRQTKADTTVRLVEFPKPLGGAAAGLEIPCTFRRVLDLGTGVYRVGLGGSNIPTTGDWLVRITFDDESTATSSFRVMARGRGQIARRHPGGKTLVMGGDGTIISQFTLYRSCYATRPREVRPYLVSVTANAGSLAVMSWRTVRRLQAKGVAMGVHGWTHVYLGDLTPTVGALHLEWAKQIELVEGIGFGVYAPPYGDIAYAGGAPGSAFPDILARWAMSRGTNPGYNDLPLAAAFWATNPLACWFHDGNTEAGADDAAKAATILGYLDGAGVNSLGHLGFHGISTAVVVTLNSTDLLNAIMDAAQAAGWRLGSFREFLGAMSGE